ncbi:MAG: M42 family metallopeptidase [Clostridiales bacterium]|nr:M42 family metallopeptidase [Clostridiales bacterium]
MEYKMDNQYMLDCFKTLVNTPSPVSYYEEINPVMEKLAAGLGLAATYDRKHTGYIELEGEDNKKTVLVSAHLDTLGLVVRGVDSAGNLLVRPLGGVNFTSLEGESVTIHARNGKKYTGLMVCRSHSTHVFDDARSIVRDENSMIVSLDQRITSKEEVRALGIENGDIISVEPHFEYTEKGYIKSRFIDDKACVAAVLGAVKFLKDQGMKPKYRTLLSFTHYEEINHGGAYVPPEAEEFLAVDIGLIGPDYNGTEKSVSICCKDNFSPYDREMTSRLIRQAKKAGCDYAVDVFYRYGTDAGAAIRGGANLSAGAVGMGCFASHGRERTHMLGVENTAKLVAAYMLDED